MFNPCFETIDVAFHDFNRKLNSGLDSENRMQLVTKQRNKLYRLDGALVLQLGFVSWNSRFQELNLVVG